MASFASTYGPGVLVNVTAADLAADNTLVAAPGAGRRLVVRAGFFYNPTAAAVTYSVKSGATVLSTFVLGVNQFLDLKSLDPEDEEDYGVFMLGVNEALILNASAVSAGRGTLRVVTIQP